MGLRTQRNNWYCNVTLFKTAEEARKEGFGLMYDDPEGSVYGIHGEGMGHWERIGFVPKEGKYDSYYERALPEEVVYPRKGKAE